MTHKAIDRLQLLSNKIPKLLLEIDEVSYSMKINPQKWSKKEIIGHLIDSATNNHHRFVRGQFEDTPRITYDQNQWNANNYYQYINATQLISFWEFYNKQLVQLLKNIPSEKLLNMVDTGGENTLTLEFLIEDYILHLEHHLKQIIDYTY